MASEAVIFHSELLQISSQSPVFKSELQTNSKDNQNDNLSQISQSPNSSVAICTLASWILMLANTLTPIPIVYYIFALKILKV